MLESLIAALLLVIAVTVYLAVRLSECKKELRVTQISLASIDLERRAYLNQLLTKQGSPPIFDADGAIVINHLPDDVPIMQILRPPFAQAEHDWEREDEEQQALNLRDTVIGTAYRN